MKRHSDLVVAFCVRCGFLCQPCATSLRDLGASIWSPHHETLTPARVDQAHALGLRVVPWTVNDAARISALIDMGVDGVISDLGGDVTLSRFPRSRAGDVPSF